MTVVSTILISVMKTLLVMGLVSCAPKVSADLATGEILVSFIPASQTNNIAVARTASSIEAADKSTVKFLATQASFGTYPPQHKDARQIEDYSFTFNPVFSPDVDPLLCNTDEEMAEIDPDQIPNYDSSVVMLVPRGTCTFERKALNAQNHYNAGAIIIYGTDFSRYGYNETSEEVIFPKDKYDYDCSYGEGHIDYNDLTFNPTYDSSNDDLLDYKCETSKTKNTCASHKCLVTSSPNAEGVSKICCAWDLPIWLYADFSNKSNTTDTIVSIPAMYITMTQIDDLKDIIQNNDDVELSLFARNRPSYNTSAVLVWALGVFTAVLASYLSAGEIRNKYKRIRSHSLIDRSDQVIGTGRNQGRLRSRSPGSRTIPRYQNVDSPPSFDAIPSIEQSQNNNEGVMEEEESLEITLFHALFFLVYSSISLLVLFYFKIYNVVKIMYAFGCAGALSQVMIVPLLRFLTYGKVNIDRTFFRMKFMDIGEISYLDFIAFVTSYALGFSWMFLIFTQPNASQIPFVWIMQDLMGVSICVAFLSVLRVNNLKIATVLLVVAFFYDIFFVFITPYLFSGKSVMVTVATSGGAPTADALWCEKYPRDNDCKGGEPLPMLLTVPRLADYQGGASMLGLGDIVLPGLALSFASRLDESRRLVASMNGNGGVGRRACMLSEAFSGYFGPIVVAYAIGLLMANAAVYIMQMGQPALLYLVPLCLGALFFVGWKKGEITELWNGPKILKTAEEIVRDSNRVDNGNRNEETTDDISMKRIEVN